MIEQLACELGRKDEVPNIELAEMLWQNEDIVGTKEISASRVAILDITRDIVKTIPDDAIQ